jgi:hypothetical protein
VNQILPYGYGETTALQLAETTKQTRGERSREWLELFFQTTQAAEVLARTDFVPATMKGKPEQVAAAMMKGYELDIDPLDALANIYSVHGRIGFYAEFMRRRIIQAGHEIRIVEANDSRAVIEGRRAGSQDWQRVSFTAQQAQKAKIDLSGYPEDKLVARATSRLCKRVFPEVLSGAAIAEDLMDDVAAVHVPSERADAPAAVTAGTVQRKRRPAVAPSPRSEPPAVVDVSAADEPLLPGDTETAGQEMSTPAQWQKLAILLGKEPELTERDAKLAYLATQFGRPFGSSKELTKVEASQLIDFLENPAPDAQEVP